MGEIAIAIIFFEKLDQTIECVNSVSNSNLPVYILNNNSSKKSTDRIKEYYKDNSNIHFFDAIENLGPSKGRNFLIKNIKEEWIFFLDNDIIVETKDWYEKIFCHIQSEPEIEAFVPRLFNVHENKFVQFHEYQIKDKRVEGFMGAVSMINCFPGGAACVNKKLFYRIGLYEESLMALEDFEFSIRAILLNAPIRALLINNVELNHDHRIAKNSNDELAIKERYKNDHFIMAEEFIREKYNIKYYSGWQPWVADQKKIMLKKKRVDVHSIKKILSRIF